MKVTEAELSRIESLASDIWKSEFGLGVVAGGAALGFAMSYWLLVAWCVPLMAVFAILRRRRRRQLKAVCASGVRGRVWWGTA
jgi:hypothetical protein